MITLAELKENGFIKDFEWNNRVYFTKNGFNIVEHFGVSRYDEDHLSGYGKNFETIEELNEAYKEWVKSCIDEYEKLGDIIKFLKESLY
jgi:superfamily I DNA and/or RNA helicase